MTIKECKRIIKKEYGHTLYIPYTRMAETTNYWWEIITKSGLGFTSDEPFSTKREAANEAVKHCCQYMKTVQQQKEYLEVLVKEETLNWITKARRKE